MPNPGIQSIKASIINTPLSVKGFNTTFVDGTFTQQLAQGISDGWPGIYPTTVTTCGPSIVSALGSFVYAGEGVNFIQCLGQGIDDDIALWAASWHPKDAHHHYAPSVGSIVAKMQACFPRYSHNDTLRTAVASAFMSGFVQEAG